MSMRIVDVTSCALIALSLISPAIATLPVYITATGASFPADVYTKAVSEFQRQHADVIKTFAYMPSSSGSGQSDQASGIAAWSGSDIAIKSNFLNLNPPLVALPAMGGAIAVVYNIPELDVRLKIRFSRSVLPAIFKGNITAWNDPRLLADNDPSVVAILANLTKPIQIVVGSAGSGTSANFLATLAKMDSTFPSSKTFKQLVPNAYAASSNEAVASIVSSIPYTMSYMDTHEVYRSGVLSDGYVQNSNGQYVLANTSTITTALLGLSDNYLNTVNFLNGSVTALDSPVKNAYPISLITNFVIRQNNISSDPDVTRWTLRFFWWFLTSQEMAQTVLDLHFIPITNTSVGGLTLQYLQEYQYIDPATMEAIDMYGESVCDVDINGVQPRPCQHGYCPDLLPFQQPYSDCICVTGYYNEYNDDCSEPIKIIPRTGVSFASLALCALSVTCVLVVTALLFRYRGTKKIKATAPELGFVILFGCFLGSLGIIPYTANPTTIVCSIRPLLPAVAFGLVFGLIQTGLMIAGVDLILCIIYAFVASPDAETRIAAGTGVDALLDVLETYLVCVPDADKTDRARAIEVAIYVYNVILVIVCLYLAFKTRKAEKRFSETKSIGFVTAITVVTLSFGLIIIYAIPVTTVKTDNIVIMVRSLLITVITCFTAIFLFIPRLHSVMNKKNPWTDEASEGSDGARSFHSIGSLNNNQHKPGDASTKSEVKNYEAVAAQALNFEIGIRKLAFAAQWNSANLLVLPELDMIFILQSIKTAKVIVSFRISSLSVSSLYDAQKNSIYSTKEHTGAPAQKSTTSTSSNESSSEMRTLVFRGMTEEELNKKDQEGNSGGGHGARWVVEFLTDKSFSSFNDFMDSIRKGAPIHALKKGVGSSAYVKN
ncbi:hypothetical protein HDU76_012774 [Blyttiomyces sp. JEL0837]|nr:hypothetical protein HDU76_012774 [Blyttiomyces sp. JEL0837]